LNVKSIDETRNIALYIEVGVIREQQNNQEAPKIKRNKVVVAIWRGKDSKKLYKHCVVDRCIGQKNVGGLIQNGKVEKGSNNDNQD
jgi:hypothetical protein